MTTPARDDSAELQPTRVGNPMLAQVRDFIDADEAPPALDPIGIARRALRGRERRVALITVLVALLAATIAYVTIKPSYQSSGMLRVLPREGKILYSDSDDSRLRLYDAFVTAEMQLLTSRPTLEAALQHLQLDHDHSFPLPDNVGALAAMITVSGKKGLISLAARSGNPWLSAASVNSVIAAYEENNEAARSRHYDVRREELRSRENELEKALAELNIQYLDIGGEHDASTLSKAHVAKTAQLEVIEERLAELDNTIVQLQSTGGVGGDLGNAVEIQRATLLDQAMADMTYERAQRLAALATLQGRYRPSHPKLRAARGELEVLEDAIAERRDQIAMLGKAGALMGNRSAAKEESVEELETVRDNLRARRKAVRSEAADLNTKLIHIRGIVTEKSRLEELLTETKRALDEVLVESQNDLSRAIEIIALGKVPDGPIEDKRKPAALGAFVFGGLGTLGFVIGGCLLAGRVRFSDDLERHSTEALAAVIPEEKNPRSSFGEAALKLRNELDLRWLQRESNSLVVGVVGTRGGAGTTSVARALGEHCSSTGVEVLLIELDGGEPSQSCTGGPSGAAAVARGEVLLAESVERLTNDGRSTWLLRSAGSRDAQQAGGELSLEDMRNLLAIARAEYPLVILDLGKLVAGRQSAIGTALADRSILVAACGNLRREIGTAKDLIDRLAPSRYLLTLNRASSLDPALAASSGDRRAISVSVRQQIAKLINARHGA